MSRILIACGGTGGHLAPGIAVAQELVDRGHKCKLVITQKTVDQRLASAYPNLSFMALNSLPWTNKFWKWPGFFYHLIQNFLTVTRCIKKEKIDLVLAFGGFLSLGVVLSAAFLRKPCFLHEANRYPGKATRFLKFFAKRIYLPRGMALKHIHKRIVRNYGFPVRKEIRKMSKSCARKELHMSMRQRLLVVLGGSQGAKAFNRWVIENCEWLGKEDINVICVTGIGKVNESKLEETHTNGRTTKTIFIPFSANVSPLLSAADLVISRAGAGTIAELIRCEVPSILVPYPFAANNHQMANALFFECQGGCMVVSQSKIDTLLNEVIQLINDDDLLNFMQQNLRCLNRNNATFRISNDIENYCNRIIRACCFANGYAYC